MKRVDRTFATLSPEIGRRVGEMIYERTGSPVDLNSPDTAVHVLGIGSGLVGAAALLAWAATSLAPEATAALVVYCIGLIAVLGCSGAYHMSRTPARKNMLRRLDHAAIFVKIAGTYTPFALVKMGGTRA